MCVFDGLEWIKERCVSWYGSKKSEKLAGELLREDERSFAASNVEEGKNKKEEGVKGKKKRKKKGKREKDRQ